MAIPTERPDMDDLPHTTWTCEWCDAENSCIDGTCQYCSEGLYECTECGHTDHPTSECPNKT